MTDISQHFHALGAAIQFAHESHRATGQNLANVNTPNYKTKELPFEQLLNQLDNPDSSGTIDVSSFQLKETPGLAERVDGNNVDLDREMAMMKKNALAYQTLTQLLGSKMSIIQRSISG
jgi:flagellar basal-body rod protein FlgB